MTGVDEVDRVKNVVGSVASIDDSTWAVDDKVTEVIDGTQAVITQSRRKHPTLRHLDENEPK